MGATQGKIWNPTLPSGQCWADIPQSFVDMELKRQLCFLHPTSDKSHEKEEEETMLNDSQKMVTNIP